MRVKIGSTLFIGGDSKYQLAPPVEGLESPDIRIGDGVYAGRDGGYVSGHFYGHRVITLNGFYIGDDCEHATQLRQQLFQLLRIRYRLPIIVEDFNEKTFYTEGYVEDIKCDVNSPVAGEFQLTLKCPDPFFYECQGENPKWYKYNLPVGTSINVPNEGTVEAWPIITIAGGIENPTITNGTTLQSLSLDITTEDSDVLIINTEKRLILLNDEAINETRTLDSSWWNLIQGANNVLLEADSTSGSVTGITVNSWEVGGGTTLAHFVPADFENNALDWINTQGASLTIVPTKLHFGYQSSWERCYITIESTMDQYAVHNYELRDPDAMDLLLEDAELLGISQDVQSFLNNYDPTMNYTGYLALNTSWVIDPNITAEIKLKKGYAGI